MTDEKTISRDAVQHFLEMLLMSLSRLELSTLVPGAPYPVHIAVGEVRHIADTASALAKLPGPERAEIESLLQLFEELIDVQATPQWAERLFDQTETG